MLGIAQPKQQCAWTVVYASLLVWVVRGYYQEKTKAGSKT